MGFGKIDVFVLEDEQLRYFLSFKDRQKFFGCGSLKNHSAGRNAFHFDQLPAFFAPLRELLVELGLEAAFSKVGNTDG